MCINISPFQALLVCECLLLFSGHMTGMSKDMNCKIVVQKGEEATVVVSIPQNIESSFSLKKYSSSSHNTGMELLWIVTIPTKTSHIDIFYLMILILLAPEDLMSIQFPSHWYSHPVLPTGSKVIENSNCLPWRIPISDNLACHCKSLVMCTVILQFLQWLACSNGYFCKHHIWLSKVMFLKHLILMETPKLIMIITKSYKLLFCKQSQTHCAIQTTHDKNHITIHVNRAINIAVYYYRLVNNNCIYGFFFSAGPS